MPKALKINAVVNTHRDALLKIKLEIDRDPPLGFDTTTEYLLSPTPYSVVSVALPDLFAGKMHALLCRKRVLNVKGRDWYDLIWCVNRGVTLNLEYLKAKMVQSENFDRLEKLDSVTFCDLFREKLQQVDFRKAQEDVRPFLKDSHELDSLHYGLPISLSAVYYKN